MKTKKADTLYCGVDEDKIKNAQPIISEENLKHLYDFLTDRYDVHKKKDVEKLPAPWTNNEVIQQYRFTNVRREHDRESIWLIDNIAKSPHLSLQEKLLNCIIFRTWNRNDTFRLLGGPYTNEQFHDDQFSDLLQNIRTKYQKHHLENPKQVYWTPVFNTGGLKSAWFSPRTNSYIGSSVGNLRVKYTFDGEEFESPYREFRAKTREVSHDRLELIEFIGVDSTNENFVMWEKDIPLRVLWMAKWVYDQGLVDKMVNAIDQKEVTALLQKIPGIAYFLSYQVFVDFTYIPEFKFSENEFTASGPGCERGLKYIFKDTDGMTWEECLFWLRDNQEDLFGKYGYDPDSLFSDLPKHDRALNVMSLENLHCELSKYIRAKTGTGRPRNRYRVSPYSENLLTIK